MPGAGDEEETWARSLTADMFWAHAPRILGAGPGGTVAEVDAIVATAAGGRVLHAGSGAAGAGAGSDASAVAAAAAGVAAARPRAKSLAASAAAARPGLHNLPPLGCRAAAVPGSASVHGGSDTAPEPLEHGGVRWIGATARPSRPPFPSCVLPQGAGQPAPRASAKTPADARIPPAAYAGSGSGRCRGT